MNEYRNYSFAAAQSNGNGRRDIPVVPLPPGEGMPAPPGNGGPVAPLPPNNGMPAPPGNGGPVAPLPPNNGMPAPPGNGEPVIPLPPVGGMPAPPGNGGPVIPLPPVGGTPAPPGSNRPVIPLPPVGGPPAASGGPIIVPIGFSQVRFLQAAVNYGPLTISIGSREYASNLAFGNLSSYGRVNDGFRTVTIMSSKAPRTVLYKKSIPFVAGTKVTMALVNSSSGIELVQISDEGCTNRQRNMGCFRVANLSYNSTPVDVMLNTGRIVFTDVRFKEVTSYKQARPGDYSFFVVETPRRFRSLPADIEIIEPFRGETTMSDLEEGNYLLSFYLKINPGVMYTAYLIGNDGFTPGLQVLLVENN